MIFKPFLVAGTILGALAVALGALGAHGLQRMVDQKGLEQRLVQTFHTGVEYQFYHTLALLGAGILYAYFPGSWMRAAGWCYLAGILCFSGSLYAITLLKISGGGSIGVAGVITPLGGLILIAGWVCALVAVLLQRAA